jgi:CO/xanthine dehydrogenase FAD-binding subunit
MDLVHVDTYRAAHGRDDLRLATGERLLGGGTWLFSEPQPDTTGLVDLTTLGWPAWERDGATLRIGATCTIAELLEAPWGDLAGLARDAAEALLMSFKVQHVATVGGNLCLALPAGAMTSLCAGLGGTAVVWTPDGGERREPVASFVHGVRRTALAPGEVLRAVEVPLGATAAVLRRTSLAPLGRSSAVVVATPDAVTVTASTTRPVVLDPGGALGAQLDAVDCWYDDPHGPADWRRAMTTRLVHDAVAALEQDAA